MAKASIILILVSVAILDFNNFHWLNPKIVPKINKMQNISIQSYLTNSESTCEAEGLIKRQNEKGI